MSKPSNLGIFSFYSQFLKNLRIPNKSIENQLLNCKVLILVHFSPFFLLWPIMNEFSLTCGHFVGEKRFENLKREQRNSVGTKDDDRGQQKITYVTQRFQNMLTCENMSDEPLPSPRKLGQSSSSNDNIEFHIFMEKRLIISSISRYINVLSDKTGNNNVK